MGCHFCGDELMALLALLASVKYLPAFVRGLWAKRHQAPICRHGADDDRYGFHYGIWSTLIQDWTGCVKGTHCQAGLKQDLDLDPGDELRPLAPTDCPNCKDD